MAKYSFLFKKTVVQDYLSRKGGSSYLAKKYNIGNCDNKQVLKWVNAYKEFGDAGLLRLRKKKSYAFDFKLNVVELYLATEVSYQELALSVGMNSPQLITKWVNDFRIAGPDALKPKPKGRKRKVDKPKNTITDTANTIDAKQEYLKQLENENLKLRIENAYLKELRRLRLEDEARLREQQESSTASEESSN